MDARKEEMTDDKATRVDDRRRSDESGDGDGRVWIFLVLGALALVFSSVLTGVYMNLRSLTSSIDHVEVMPTFVPAAAGGLTGLLVLILLWRRYKIVVYSVLVLCAVTVVLCVISAVLTGTHILQPLLSVSGCVYSRRDGTCRCATRFHRDRLELEMVADGEQAYIVLQDVSSCGDLQDILPGMLFAMIGIYGVMSLISVAAGVISLLVYQTELRRRYIEDVEDDTCSPPPSPSSSGNYAEHHSMLPAHTASAHSATTLINIYTNASTSATEEDNINDDGNTTPSDLIYGPADIPMGYAEACSMRRCQSFSQPRSAVLREGSPGSSASSQTASLIGGERAAAGAERSTGRLQEHRKKGRRAVTLHGLDREQLLLILSLQMRYLQESDQSSKREMVSKNCSHINNKTDCGPDGMLSSGSEGGPGCVLNSGPEDEHESRSNSGPGSGPSHYGADSFWLPSDQQRRAMTPTPRQERLSSSRTTDDDLDYRPAKLARSHTPQPYHFKNPGQYSQSLNSSSPFQPHQHHYQQHKQSQQQEPQVAHHNEENEEPPTLITYDLRNITKTGPIVYENIPSSGSSLSHNHPSSSLQGSNNAKMISRLPPAGHLQSLPVHQPDPAGQVLILGGNVHGAGKSKNQLSRQTSQASTSSQMSLESSPSDTRRLVPSKEKTPEPAQDKIKGKKKLTKKEKNVKKEDETAQAVSGQSGLCRTATRGGAVADRWQTLMESGPKQVQTLWENVQRKIVSDSQTPDSTLDVRHPPSAEHQSQETSSTISSFISPTATPRHGSFQAVTTQQQQISFSQTVPNGILKNSNAVASYSPGPSVATTHNVPQNLPLPLSPNQGVHYSSQFPTQNLCTYYHNAFLPVATSSVGNYEDIDEVFPSGQQTTFVPSFDQYTSELQTVAAPPKPPRIFGRQITKFGTVPSCVQPAPESSSQNLRPKSYMNAVDREVAGKNSFVSPCQVPLRAAAQGTDMEHHMITHLLMEGPVIDSGFCHITDRPPDGGNHFQTGNEHVYSQPHRKSNINLEFASTPSQYSPGHIYQNACQYPDQSGQFNNMQRQHHHENNIPPSQWSACQPFDHNHQAVPPPFYDYPTGSHEACDTDLDDLPRPQHHRQPTRSQIYSPPHMTFTLGHPLELDNLQTTTRSPSTSSCEPQNTSCTSSDRSTTPSFDLQRSFPNHTQTQLRALQTNLITDRRFCVTQQLAQLKPHQL